MVAYAVGEPLTSAATTATSIVLDRQLGSKCTVHREGESEAERRSPSLRFASRPALSTKHLLRVSRSVVEQRKDVTWNTDAFVERVSQFCGDTFR